MLTITKKGTIVLPGPQVGGRSPWGTIDHVSEVSEGKVWLVSTPGHGGYKLSAAANKLIPAEFRKTGGWYEEDCDWVLVVLFGDRIEKGLFDAELIASAHRVAKDWHPHAYQKATGNTLEPSQSYVLRKEIFRKQNADRWVVISASSNKSDPSLVDLIATKGGIHGDGFSSPIERKFVVKSSEYRRGEFGFVIDENIHKAID